MQVTGRSIVLTTVAVALVMSGGAWWYRYRASRQAAEFWGPTATRLLIGKGDAAFFELATAHDDEVAPSDRHSIAGFAITSTHDLTDQPGLIHLRHALTQDASFDWSHRRRQPKASDSDWGYAMQFGDDRGDLEILWRRDFKEMGMVAGGSRVEVLPCPRLAAAVQAYLRDAGVLPPAESSR